MGDRAQRQRMLWTRIAASSYAIDTLFLALFAVAGSAPAGVAFGYGVAAVLVSAAAMGMHRSQLNRRLEDPNMTVPLIAVAVVMQLAVVAWAPRLGFPFLANLFTVYAFAMLSLTVRNFVQLGLLGAIGVGWAILGHGEELVFALATPAERALQWLFFCLILARFLLLCLYANRMRERLAESRRQVSASLAHIQELVSHDELTRVLNRRALMERLTEEKSRADRAGAPFSVALLDLDHFKAINDTHGHLAGDAVLKTFSARVLEAMREADVFGRYGGEEFLLILVGAQGAVAFTAVDRIRARVAAHDWSALAPGLALTVSGGVSAYRPGESIDALLSRADGALYEAKGAGRNRVVAG